MIRKQPTHATANDNDAPDLCGACLHWSYPHDAPCICLNTEMTT